MIDLKLFRTKELKINQSQLADKLGIAQTYVAKMENGVKPISNKVINKINQIYKVDLEDTKYSTSKKSSNIPFYDLGVSAGDIAMFDDMAEEEPSFYLASPDYKDCNMGLRVYGSSMEPFVSGGDYVIVKEIKDLDLIQLGETYIVFSEEQRMLKMLKKAEKETDLLCVSINPHYEPFPIKKTKIKKLFIVKGVLKRISN